MSDPTETPTTMRRVPIPLFHLSCGRVRRSVGDPGRQLRESPELVVWRGQTQRIAELLDQRVNQPNLPAEYLVGDSTSCKYP